MRQGLPAGTVTFLFTDVEGSTRLLHEVGAEGYAAALAEHRRLVREACAAEGGVEVDTQGDAFFLAFPSAAGAVAAAQRAQEMLATGPIRVRMGLHTGTPHLSGEGYVGEDVHLGARIAAAGHGGQVLLSAATRAAVDGEMAELGEHRLKDFDSAVAIFQLGSERFPPLRTISNTNLPRPASSFVGREREVAEITALLRDGARLLTLTGPGGSGKTRLALEAAAELVPDFKAGVFWVELAAVRDPELVPTEIAQTLGAKDALTEHIGERELLLVLDNLEQVVDAAPTIADLVEACPNLRLLDTSRELLRVRGEVDYPVPPLADSDGVELFAERAALEPDASVRELCRRLDNLPLALELAAARTTVLTPTQILERLAKRLDLLKGGRDADPRQQTLRATIEWSHDLLNPDEQQLFARLAVFHGGSTLDAAETVCDADLDVLQSLVDKNLLRHTGDRFWMLETIREYALERLEASGEEHELRRRHADWIMSVAYEAEPHILGLEPQEWLERLDAEHDNLRAALDWLESAGETQRGLALGGSVWEFWCLRSHYVEGWRRLEHLLELDLQPTKARAKALTGSAHLASGAGVTETASVARAEEALALHRDVGDEWGVAFALSEYGGRLCEAGEFARALPVLAEGSARLQEVGDVHRELQSLRLVAWAHLHTGHPERYREIHEEIIVRARDVRDAEAEWWSLANLSEIASDEGRHQDAFAMLERAHAIGLVQGDPAGIDMTLIRLARALAYADRPTTAARVLGAADALHVDIGWSYPGWFTVRRDEAVERARAALGDSAFEEERETGRRLTPEEAATMGLAQA